MFADVKELRSGAALNLQTRLRQAAAAVRRPQHGSSYPVRPPQAHLLPLYGPQTNLSGHPASSGPPHTAGATGSHPNFTTAGSGAVVNIPVIAQPLRYVLLCVNTRRLRVLEHINVTTVTADESLFDLLRERYNLARKSHNWQLPVLRWIIPLWKWIWDYRGDLSMLTPKSADYVQVC